MPSKEAIELCIGKNITRLRKLRGMRQKQLAELVGTTFQTISKYECGAASIPGYRLYDIADALEVTVDALFFGMSFRSSSCRISSIEQAA